MKKISLHDTVVFKATPNSGQMMVTDIKDSYKNFIYANSENPVIFVKYWNMISNTYTYASFYSNHLIKVDKE